ncbi:phage protein [Xenorhabdus budapestensis]|uniref:Phage protein n=1 Tax=Xenorhabdus budapestensis TaxID=290110 RepID=A0A2D0J3P7_XENBU|nr:phage protein [Xenorhabdus budapestensis]
MEWIKCSDRLPELEDESVLVYFGNAEYPTTGAIDVIHIEDAFGDITAGVDEKGNQLWTK